MRAEVTEADPEPGRRRRRADAGAGPGHRRGASARATAPPRSIYLLGSGAARPRDPRRARPTAELLGRAVELDPGFGPRPAQLALARCGWPSSGSSRKRTWRPPAEAADAAAFLDPERRLGPCGARRRLPDAGRSRARPLGVRDRAGDRPGRHRILAYFAGWAPSGGEAERGAAIADRVVLVDPNVPPPAAAQFARAYFMAGRYRAALAMVDRVPADGHSLALRAIHAGALAAVGRTWRPRRRSPRRSAPRPGPRSRR